MTATPTKLRNGSWGARVQAADVSQGDTITITTRSGKSWQATVTRVLWSGDGMAICATESRDRPSQLRQAAPYSGSYHPAGGNCSRCCRTATRTAQIWEDCPHCGAEPVYM